MWVFASLLLLCISLLFFFGAPQLSWSVNFRRIRMSIRYVFMFGFLQNVFCNSQYQLCPHTLIHGCGCSRQTCGCVPWSLSCVVWYTWLTDHSAMTSTHVNKLFQFSFFVKFEMWTARQYVIYNCARNYHLLILFLLSALRISSNY